MFQQQNNLNNIPLHIPMPMHPINHFPNQIEEIPSPSTLADSNQETFTEVINISKIKDGFFIGDKLAAISIDVIIQFKITHFINATGSQIMNQWESVGINYLTLNWSENERQILFDGKDEIAERIVQFIDNSFIEGEGLLAHSFKGQNRVCIVVLIYLMKKYKWSLNKSMDYLKSKKNDVEIVPYFYIQLVKFEERLKQRGELNNDIPWPSTYLLKDKDETLICNTYMNGLPSEKENLKINNINNNELIRHIIWNDENPSQKGPLEIVDREHDLFLEKDIRPVTSHQRIRPTKKCIKYTDNNNVMNMVKNYNVFNNYLNKDKNDVDMSNNYMENNNNENKNIRLIGSEKYNMPGVNPVNNNNNNQINKNNNYNNNNMPAYNLGSLNSLNPTNMKNYGVIYDNNNNINNNRIINKNGINFNKNNNYNPNEFDQNNNQINNTNTSINMKKNNSHNNNNNNNINNKVKRSSSNKKSDKTNNLSNSSQNFIHNKLNNNNIVQGKPLNNSMNDFADKRNKINNNENINNNMLNNNFMNRSPLVEDIYGNNFDYIKHNNNTFLANNNYNNRNINNNKINKAQYAINYNNNNIHNGYNNLIKNKPLNNFNPSLIKKKGTPQGHTLLNRNKNNTEEGPVKIKKNNYIKNSNNNISNFNYNSNKKPTTPDLNHYSTTGFLSENNANYNTNHSMTKTNSSSILGARGNSLQKNEKSTGIFGYGTKTNFKNKFSIKRPATAPHKDKVKVPTGAINKKNYIINGDKKAKIGKFNQRPQSAEGKNNKNTYKSYNTTNNYNSNMNGIMGYNKNLSNSNVVGVMNSNKKYGINNIKNNLQNKRISSPINPGNSNINNNKNLFNGSKYNNPKFRMPSPMIKPTNNIQRKNIIGNGTKIGTSKSTNINFK